jgi:hypothetical protein
VGSSPAVLRRRLEEGKQERDISIISREIRHDRGQQNGGEEKIVNLEKDFCLEKHFRDWKCEIRRTRSWGKLYSKPRTQGD